MKTRPRIPGLDSAFPWVQRFPPQACSLFSLHSLQNVGWLIQTWPFCVDQPQARVRFHGGGIFERKAAQFSFAREEYIFRSYSGRGVSLHSHGEPSLWVFMGSLNYFLCPPLLAFLPSFLPSFLPDHVVSFLRVHIFIEWNLQQGGKAFVYWKNILGYCNPIGSREQNLGIQFPWTVETDIPCFMYFKKWHVYEATERVELIIYRGVLGQKMSWN